MTNSQDLYNQIKTFVFGILLFLNIDKDVLAILCCIILINMFVGMLKSVFVPELHFELKIFWGGLVKKILLLVIVLTLSLLAKGLGLNELQPMTSIIMKAMLLSEVIKILNNIRSILNKKEYKSSDFISIIIEKITGFLGFQINRLLTFFDK